jgi:hypothetical protein
MAPLEPIEPLIDAGPSTLGTRRQVARPAAGLVALLAGLGAGLAPGRPAHAAGPQDWRLERNAPAGRPLVHGVGVRLVNVTNGDVLAYGDRSHGINLVWQNNDGQENIRFYKESGGIIRYGDRVALNVQGGAYVRYGERDYGINLVWSSSPVYNWEFFGGTAGAPVQTGPQFLHGLRNMTIGKPMVYGERQYGINLVWYG